MKGLGCGTGLTIAVLVFCPAAPAGAQENLDAGKSGAQLFASDCLICHKSAQSVAKSRGLFGLSGFLREHYTASRESAGVIAAYLDSLGNPPAPAKRTGQTKRTAKGAEKLNPEANKPDEKKPGMAKTGEGKSRKSGDAKTPESKVDDGKRAEPKPSNSKSSESKSSESKSSESKSSEVKPAEPKPAEAKSSEPKSNEPKSSEPKSNEPKLEAKPDKPEKSD